MLSLELDFFFPWFHFKMPNTEGLHIPGVPGNARGFLAQSMHTLPSARQD